MGWGVGGGCVCVTLVGGAVVEGGLVRWGGGGLEGELR